MDATRFDALARTLATPASRRAAGRFLAGLGLAGVLAQVSWIAADAAKKKKGKKRKKRKPKQNQPQPECREDDDCAAQAESCQGERCRLVCPAGACPGCVFCAVRLAANGERSRVCSSEIDFPNLVTPCDSDADCPESAPLCINFSEASCTSQCGTCVVSTGPCNQAECQADGDCENQSEACQGGSCQSVCPSGACPGCNFCAVRYLPSGERTQECGDSFSFTDTQTCSTDDNCDEGDVCIRFPTTSCTQPPCGQCAFDVETCP